MQIQNSYPNTISNQGNSNGTSRQQIKIPSIDPQNIEQLISKEFLKNYTYLEYCMFPQLFQLYIGQMEQRELQNLLESYMGIFVEFFPLGNHFESSYQGKHAKLWDWEYVQRLVDRYYQGDDEDKDKSLDREEKQVNEKIICDAFGEIIQQLDELKQNINQGIKQTSLLNEIVQVLDCVSPKLQLLSMSKQIQQHKISGPLYVLIRMLIRQLARINYTSPFSKYPRYKYLIHAALWTISKEERAKIKGGNCQIDQLIQMLQIRLIPFEMELNELLRGRTGQVKEGAWVELFGPRGYGVKSYRKILELVKSVDLFLREYKIQFQHTAFPQPSQSFKPLYQIADFVQNIIASHFQNQTIIENISKDGKTIEPAKQLSNQNVQKIAKVLSKLQINQKMEVETMEIEHAITVDDIERVFGRKSVKVNAIEDNMKEQLDVDFLLLHSLLYETIQSDPHDISAHIKIIQQIFSQINQTLFQLFTSLPRSLQQTIQKINCLNYQCSLIIQGISFAEEKMRENNAQMEFNLKERLIKIKNSLYANILSIKVLLAAFSPAKKHQDELKLIHDEQLAIKDINEIRQLLNDILKYSIDCSTSLHSSLSQSFSSTSSQKQQLTTLPCLQCIFLLFSSIQLWYELSTSFRIKSKKRQIEQFMESVIKKYSQQNVKIGTEEIIFVERILVSLQVFQQIGRDVEYSKVNEIIGKLMGMEREKGLNIASVINQHQALEKILQVMSFKLLAACLPMTKQQNQLSVQNNNDFNQNLLKIPFWKCVLVNYFNDLTGSELAEMVEEKIFSKWKDVFVNAEKFVKQDKAVDLDDQTATKSNSIKTLLTLNSSEQMNQLFEVFCELNDKNLRMIELKQELYQQKGNQDVSNQVILEQQKNKSMKFYMQLISLMYLSASYLKQSLIEYDAIFSPTTNHPLNKTITQRLHSLITLMTSQTNQIIRSLIENIIEPKLQLFKPSNQQVNCLLDQSGVQQTEGNGEKMTGKIMELQKLYNQMVELSLLGLSFLAWVKMELTVKVQTLQEKNGNRTQLEYSSTFYLLQTITLLSLSSSSTLSVNFETLESYLESNVEPTPKPSSQILMSHHQFPHLPLTSSSVRTQMQFLDSFMFLEFIYESLPFEISSEEEEIELFNLSVDYVLKKENHQFFSSQKEEKIRFNKVCNYLKEFNRLMN